VYCDRCGSELQDRQQYCGSCGKPVAPVAKPARRGRVAKHLSVLGILWIVFSVMHLARGTFVATLLPGMMHWGRTAAFGWGRPHFFLPEAFFGMFGGFLVILSVLGIIAGCGLLARQPWARTMAIIFGCFALMSFPFGTALGIYTLWVLGSSDSGREYREAA
jgi:hypothetical protein